VERASIFVANLPSASTAAAFSAASAALTTISCTVAFMLSKSVAIPVNVAAFFKSLESAVSFSRSAAAC
jgi:hypothetical protein